MERERWREKDGERFQWIDAFLTLVCYGDFRKARLEFLAYGNARWFISSNLSKFGLEKTDDYGGG